MFNGYAFLLSFEFAGFVAFRCGPCYYCHLGKCCSCSCVAGCFGAFRFRLEELRFAGVELTVDGWFCYWFVLF